MTAGTPIEACTPEPAAPSHAGAIADLCRRAFVGAPEWQARTGAVRAWWRHVIESAHCPVLVCVDSSGVLLGFAVDAADPAWWADIQTRGPHARATKLLTIARRPALVRTRLRKLARSREMAASTPDGVGLMTDQEQLRGARFLGLLVVNPSARGTGVADALLRAVERSAITRGETRLRIHVDARNARGRRFYERHGYQLDGYHRGSAVMVKSAGENPA